MAEPIHVVCPVCDSVNRLPTERDPKAANCGRCKNPLFQGKPVALDTARFRKHLTDSDRGLLGRLVRPVPGHGARVRAGRLHA